MALFGLTDLIAEIGSVGLWLQALGVVVVLTIIFDVIAFIFNRRRMMEIYTIKKDMTRIERKVDKILKVVSSIKQIEYARCYETTESK